MKRRGLLVSKRIEEGQVGLNDWIIYEDAGPHGADYEAYRDKVRSICEAGRGAQRRVILMTMFDYQPTFRDAAYDAPTRDRPDKSTNEAIRDEAQAQGVTVIDMNRAMDRVQAALHKRGWGSTCHKDGVHPNVFGNLVMALVLLRFMGADWPTGGSTPSKRDSATLNPEVTSPI